VIILVTKLLHAFKLKINGIVLREQRPFCIMDLREFDVEGASYHMTDGTFRNIVSKLKKAGQVELAFKSKPVFYTIPGKKFSKAMTRDHAGVSVIHSIIPESLLKDTPIYRWLKNKPIEKQALHDIRLTFKAAGIWNTFSNIYADSVNPANKGIQLPTLTYCGYIDVIVTIHRTDTVSVAVSCSFKPIAIDAKGIIELSEALTRTETHITYSMEKSAPNSSTAAAASSIPSYGKWIVKMWHFGVDTIDEYTGKEFEVTFEEGMSDLYRIYTKRMKDGKNRVRLEHQEYPHQALADAVVKKLYPDGHLFIPGTGSE
jgi:hypothetical protein